MTTTFTKQSRTAEISRSTKETEIWARVSLDDSSTTNITTDLPFLSHMLEALSCHSRIGIEIRATGDIEVDPHHLIEDVGIVLGETIFKALGGLSGIERAGCFSYPMDGTLAQVAIDLCGRRNLVWNIKFGSFTVGNLDPNLFREFFKGFVDGLRATLHINVPYSDNDHHAIEAVFKSLARSLREAVKQSGDQQYLSTKGVLDEN
jgi:imidazoleglycerol-phosphate dehydratase